MKAYILIFIGFFLVSCGSQKASLEEIQQSEPVKLYLSMLDYTNHNAYPKPTNALFRQKSDQHLIIKKVIDPKTGLIDKKWKTAWGLSYNGHTYVNLRYSIDAYHPNTFAKLDIEGRYGAVLIDNKKSPRVLNSNEIYYGGGLAGALISESAKWGKNWKDEKGNKKKILFVDTYMNPSAAKRSIGNQINYLTRRQLKKLIELNYIPINTKHIKDLKFEEVVSIIKQLNQKSL